jgi:hypothetical protein
MVLNLRFVRWPSSATALLLLFAVSFPIGTLGQVRMEFNSFDNNVMGDAAPLVFPTDTPNAVIARDDFLALADGTQITYGFEDIEDFNTSLDVEVSGTPIVADFGPAGTATVSSLTGVPQLVLEVTTPGGTNNGRYPVDGVNYLGGNSQASLRFDMSMTIVGFGIFVVDAGDEGSSLMIRTSSEGNRDNPTVFDAMTTSPFAEGSLRYIAVYDPAGFDRFEILSDGGVNDGLALDAFTIFTAAQTVSAQLSAEPVV